MKKRSATTTARSTDVRPWPVLQATITATNDSELVIPNRAPERRSSDSVQEARASITQHVAAYADEKLHRPVRLDVHEPAGSYRLIVTPDGRVGEYAGEEDPLSPPPPSTTSAPADQVACDDAAASDAASGPEEPRVPLDPFDDEYLAGADADAGARRSAVRRAPRRRRSTTPQRGGRTRQGLTAVGLLLVAAAVSAALVLHPANSVRRSGRVARANAVSLRPAAPEIAQSQPAQSPRQRRVLASPAARPPADPTSRPAHRRTAAKAHANRATKRTARKRARKPARIAVNPVATASAATSPPQTTASPTAPVLAAQPATTANQTTATTAPPTSPPPIAVQPAPRPAPAPPVHPCFPGELGC